MNSLEILDRVKNQEKMEGELDINPVRLDMNFVGIILNLGEMLENAYNRASLKRKFRKTNEPIA